MYDARDYETRIWWSKEDQLFLAQCVELPGMMAHGETREAAAQSIQSALEGLVAWKEERGEELPAPVRLAVTV